jgi:hypothetical protein
MKKITIVVGWAVAAFVGRTEAPAQNGVRPKACKATVGPEAGPFANAIVVLLPDGKIVPYKMMYRPAHGRIQMDPARRELASRGDSVELSLVYGLSPGKQGLDVQLEEVRVQAPTVFGPGRLPGDKLREVASQLTLHAGGASGSIVLEPDHVQPIDRGLITTDSTKSAKGVAVVGGEAQMRLAQALETVSSIQVVGERAGTAGTPTSMKYYSGTIPIGSAAERGAMLQQAIREAAVQAKTHPEQCN